MLEWIGEAVKDDEVIEQDAKPLMEVLSYDPEVVARRQRQRGDEEAVGDVS